MELNSEVEFISGQRSVLEGEVLGVELRDFVFEFDFSGACSSESLFEVLDFLFEFNNLVFLFVEEVGEVEVSGSSFEVLGRVLDSSSEESIEFVLEKQEPLVQVGPFFSLDGDDSGSGEIVSLELADGVLESGKNTIVTCA